MSQAHRHCSLALVIATSCATTAPTATAQDPVLACTPEKRTAVALLAAFETGDEAPFQAYDAEHYIQHNLAAEGGPAGLKNLISILKVMPGPLIKMRPLRVFQDGDTVVTHSSAYLFGPKATIDVFRFQAGKVVEHWDNLQDVPGDTPSGHTMTDGPFSLEDLDKTEANKILIKSYVDDVLVHGKLDNISHYFDGDRLVEHNPTRADGTASLTAALRTLPRYQGIHQVLGEGNFVLAMSQGKVDGRSTAFYDLFRVAGGKIAEHWDVVETIPPRSERKNDNGKF